LSSKEPKTFSHLFFVLYKVGGKKRFFHFNFRRGIFETALKDILESSTIVKVLFDCRCASDLLLHRYDVRLSNVFDVQAANAVFLTRSYTGGYLPKYTYSLSHLARAYLGIKVIAVYDNDCSLIIDIYFHEIFSTLS
jgi:3'-5' exonuclease